MTKLFRTFMVCAGDNQSMIDAFTREAADSYMIDLEFAVPESRKSVARAMAAKGMSLDWGCRKKGVRLNEVSSEHFLADMSAIAPTVPDFIMLPHVHTADEVAYAARLLDSFPEASNVRLWVMIETCAAVQNVDQIATASARMQGFFFGGADFSSDLGIKKDSLRHKSPLTGHPRQVELAYARGRIAAGAKAHGLVAIDPGEFLARDDAAATFDAAMYAFQFGFDGVAAWTTGQIEEIHRAFAPSPEDLDWAKKVVDAHKNAQRDGKSVGLVDGAAITERLAMSAEELLRRSQELADCDAALHNQGRP